MEGENFGMNSKLLSKALCCNLVRIRYVIENNLCDIDCQNENGNTALIIASREGRQDIVEFLINSGANPDIKNDYGETALYLAETKEIRDVIRQGGLPGPKGAVKF